MLWNQELLTCHISMIGHDLYDGKQQYRWVERIKNHQHKLLKWLGIVWEKYVSKISFELRAPPRVRYEQYLHQHFDGSRQTHYDLQYNKSTPQNDNITGRLFM